MFRPGPDRPRARLLAVAVVTAGTALAAPADPPKPAPPAPGVSLPTDPNAAVAFVNGNVAVTRQDLGEFLMARGGADKLDLLVNRMIIEAECKRVGVTVTDTEMQAAFNADVDGLSLDKKQFIEAVLPRYHKTLYEWMEDVVKPRLMLTKLVQGEVTVTDADVVRQFEKEYGEKRRAQIILWPESDDPKRIGEVWGKIRNNKDEFDSVARAQANPALGQTAGNIQPFGRHVHAEDPIVEQTAFQLKVNEVSGITKTKQGFLVMKVTEIIPPDATVDRAKVLLVLRQKALDEKLAAAIPEKFAALKQAAQPMILYTGPSKWRETADALVTKSPAALAAPNGVIPAAATQPAGPRVGTPGK